MEPINSTPLSINGVTPPPEPLSIAQDSSTIPLPDSIAERRAANAHYGLADKLDKPYQDYYNPIANGQEDQLRAEVASKLDYNRTLNKYDMIDQFAKAKGRPLLPEDLDNLKNFINTPLNPGTVFEQNFSDKYIQTLKNTPGFPGSWYDDAQQQMPVQVQQTEQVATDYLSKIEYARKKQEDADAQTSNQSWVGWGLDQAKSLVPGYNETKLRGNVPGVGFFEGGLLGSALEEEAKALLRLPMPEYTARFDAIMDNFNKTNPSLGSTFANAVVGQSYDAKMLNNVFTMVDISSLGSVAKVGKTVLSKAALFNESRAINKEMVLASKNVGVQPAGVIAADAAGDVGEAAVQRATNDTVKAVQGTSDPLKEASEALTAVLKSDDDKIRATPGNFGQEIINRISEQGGAFREKIVNAIENISRVERIPAVLATKEAIEAIKDNFKITYRGIQNSIMDIGDVTRNAATNTYNVTMKIGRHTGEWFLSRDEAEGFAQANGIVLKGALDDKTLARKTFLETSLKDATDKLTEYRTEKSLELTTGEARYPVSELDKRIDTIEKGIPTFQKELDAIQGSKEGATIEPKGWAFYIKATKPLNETDPVIRKFLLATDGVKTPDGWLNSFVGWLRTPDETLSLEQRLNRKVSVYTGSVLLKLAKEEAKSIRDLARFTFPGTAKKERFLDWERAIKFSQDAIDPITGEKGYFFSNIPELDSFYRTTMQRGVTNPEIEAYFAFTRLIELDRSLRNIALYRNMSRLGTESHSLNLLSKEGVMQKSDFFPGVLRKELPGGDDPMMILGSTFGQEKYGLTVADFSAKRLKEIREGVLSGEWKVIDIYNPETRPLEKFGLGNQRVRYVVTKSTVDSKPLPYDLIPRRGGGHFDFDYDQYIKQARVSPQKIGDKFNHWYEGDTTIMPIANRIVGRDVAEKLDAVRVALKAGDMGAAKAAASKLPIPMDEVMGWFKAKRGPGGIEIPARISLHEPIQVVPKNKLIGDMSDALKKRYDYTTKDGIAANSFRDGTREGSLARQFQVEYTGERDAELVNTINDIGTKQFPLYAYQPAKLIDPIPTMNRSLTKIINSTFMDDYKIFSVEHWLAEAEKYLKEDWKSAPFYHFTNITDKSFRPATPVDIKSRLLNTRFQIQQFIGIPSKTQALLDGMAQQLADSIYTKFGQGGNAVTKGLLLAPSWALARVIDPVRYLHSVAFHTVIGFWSIPQFLVQSMTYVTIFGVAGAEKAVPGSLGALLHQYGRLNRNPAILDKLDELASKLSMPGSSRWRPGEWKEANQQLSFTGFDHVAGEHALLDGALSPKIITSGVHSFLDAGTMFFKAGERNARYGAWYTAYREFRDLNPTGAISNAQRNGILERAETLAGNMTKASKSSLQMGPMSFPTQFLAYQMRLAELFTGKRLSNVKRARLIGTYAGIYGVPTAAGITGFPFTDMFRKAAIENGYVTGDNPVSTTVMEGLPAALGALITGGGDLKKGTVFNVGQRYGAPGLDIIRETLASDKPWYNILGGASFSTLSGAFEQSDGLRTAMMSAIRGDDKVFPVKSTDVTDILKQIASYNNANRFLVAANTGKWMSKNEQWITDVSPMKALFMTGTGLQTQEASDVQQVSVALKDRKSYEQDLGNHFIKEFRRGLRSQNDEPEQAKQFFTRAFAILDKGGYPVEKTSSAIALASQDNENLISRLNWDFYLQNVPEDQKEAYRQYYASKLNIQQLQGQQ